MSGEFTPQSDVIPTILHPKPAESSADLDRSLLEVLEALVDAQDASGALHQMAAAMCRSFEVEAVSIAKIEGESVSYLGHSILDPMQLPVVDREDSIFYHVVHDRDVIVDVQETVESRFFGFSEPQRTAAHLSPIAVSENEIIAIATFGDRLQLETPGLGEKLQAIRLILANRFHSAAQLASERSHLDRLIKLQNMTARIIRHDGLVDDGDDILDDIARAFGYDAVRLGLVAAEKISFYRTYRDAVKRQLPVATQDRQSGFTGKVIRTGTPQLINQPLAQDGNDSYEFKVDQLICVPLRINGEIAGVLSAASGGSRKLVVDDLGTLMMLAESIGLVVANFRRLYEVERRNHQLRLVDSLVTMIAERTMIQRAIPEIAREIANRFAFQLVGIGLIHDDRINFTLASVIVPMPPIRGITNDFGIDTGVSGRVVRTGKAEMIHDVRQDPDFIDCGWEARSAICVPIWADGHVIGVLNVESGAERPLDEADFEVLQIIARHLGIAFENEALLTSERSTRRAVEALQQVSTIVTSTLDADEALRRIVDTLGSNFDYRYVVAGLVEGGFVQPSASHGIALERLVRIAVGESNIGRVARTGQRIYVPDLSRQPDRHLEVFPEAASLIATPIVHDESILGVLIVIGSHDRRLTQQDANMLQMFAQHAGVVLDNARMYEETRQMAYIDPMTQLPNHRHFQEQFKMELERAMARDQPLAVLVLDLDGFKETNDRFGHLEGDAVLRAVGERLAGRLRDGDLVARYAGDEFVALLPNADASVAMRVGRRLCAAIGDDPFLVSSGETTRLTASVGVAIYPDHGRSTRDVLSAADNAMYVAKREGDRQVRLARATQSRRLAG
ncbi:hypothetical protein BH23CHL2_BH23CHL2_13150 [soil metagenome]